MRSDHDRLLDILEAVNKIEKYSQKGRDYFQREELVQVWIIHFLQIIGEASSGLSKDFLKDHPEIAWREIIAMRNILVHAYFSLDLDEIWNAIESDLPIMQKKILEILPHDQ
ncbi:MAG: DUF86 domain-containing protein [Candidatus Riflebacteria bacterium]|nr:DUF86 domain-containing protein [Candidatus Riflebacteria bacterium]